MKVEVKNINTFSYGFDIADVESGDVFIDKEGEVMFMTQDLHTITQEDIEEWGEEDEDMPLDSEVRLAYRLSDGCAYYYAEHEPIQRVLEFARIVE